MSALQLHPVDAQPRLSNGSAGFKHKLPLWISPWRTGTNGEGKSFHAVTIAKSRADRRHGIDVVIMDAELEPMTLDERKTYCAQTIVAALQELGLVKKFTQPSGEEHANA